MDGKQLRTGDRVRHPAHPQALVVMAVAGANAQCLNPAAAGGEWLTLPVAELTPADGSGEVLALGPGDPIE